MLSGLKQRRTCIIRGKRHVCSKREWTFEEHPLWTRHYAGHSPFNTASNHDKPSIEQTTLCLFSNWGCWDPRRVNKLSKVLGNPYSKSHFCELSSLQVPSPKTNKTHNSETSEEDHTKLKITSPKCKNEKKKLFKHVPRERMKITDSWVYLGRITWWRAKQHPPLFGFVPIFPTRREVWELGVMIQDGEEAHMKTGAQKALAAPNHWRSGLCLREFQWRVYKTVIKDTYV